MFILSGIDVQLEARKCGQSQNEKKVSWSINKLAQTNHCDYNFGTDIADLHIGKTKTELYTKQTTIEHTHYNEEVEMWCFVTTHIYLTSQRLFFLQEPEWDWYQTWDQLLACAAITQNHTNSINFINLNLFVEAETYRCWSD